ncbi:MAG: hypothetical protein ACXAE3_06860 [Candidatus Kariarchaeaceae archaeon]|jgi:hypothetical protein
MDINLNISETRSIGNLVQNDIIEFESSHITRDIFMILQIEKDDTIPAMLLQLWKFEGGYNHAVRNVMENDLGLTRQVRYFEPSISKAIVKKITEYRPEKSEYDRREELFFDVWPTSTSEIQNEECPIPFKARVEFGNDETELIIPSWTPLQRIPLDRISTGSEVEVWEVEGIQNIARVLSI